MIFGRLLKRRTNPNRQLEDVLSRLFGAREIFLIEVNNRQLVVYLVGGDYVNGKFALMIYNCSTCTTNNPLPVWLTERSDPVALILARSANKILATLRNPSTTIATDDAVALINQYFVESGLRRKATARTPSSFWATVENGRR